MLKHIVVATIASVFILAGNVFSASDPVNYRGSVEGIETGSHTIVFAIYRTQTGGTPIWQETHSDVQVTDGKFRVMLGGISLIPDSVWNGPIWLETRLDDKIVSERKPMVRFDESDKRPISYGQKTEGSLAWVEGTQPVGDITAVKTPSNGGLEGGVESGDASLKIKDGGITTAKLADNAVTSSKIKDGEVKQQDLDPTITIPNADKVDGFDASSTPTPNCLYPLDGNRRFVLVIPYSDGSVITGTNTSGAGSGIYARAYGAGVGLRAVSSSGNAINATTSSQGATTIWADASSGGGGCAVGAYTNSAQYAATWSRNANSEGVGIAALGGYDTWYALSSRIGLSAHGQIGVYAHGDAGGVAGVWGVNWGASYGVYSTGDMGCSGTKSAVVRTSKGPTELYTIESPELWFEDFGSSQLVNGRAHVELDRSFLETVTINEKYPMKVFIQLTAPCNNVYVVKGNTGFDVIELNNGKSNATFDYRVVAKRKGYEMRRFKIVPALYSDLLLYPEKAKANVRQGKVPMKTK